LIFENQIILMMNYKFLKPVFLFVLTVIFGLNIHAQDAPTAASLYNQGLEKAKAKAYVESLALMEQAIEAAGTEDNQEVLSLAKKNGTRAAYGAGNTHRKAKDYDAALAAYQKGIEYNPSYYANYTGKAQCFEGKGESAAAITAYLEAGNVAEKGGKADKATQYANKAANIVALKKGDKDWENTIICAKAYLEIQESAAVNYYLASALKETGEASKAVECIDKAIAGAAPEDAGKYLLLKAETHEALGQKNEAIRAYGQISDAKFKEHAQYRIKELSGSR
jgi:tetratricopeptide (TPR) repeat protein